MQTADGMKEQPNSPNFFSVISFMEDVSGKKMWLETFGLGTFLGFDLCLLSVIPLTLTMK